MHSVGREDSTAARLFCLSTAVHLFPPTACSEFMTGGKRDRGIVVEWTDSSGSGEQSLLCNFLAARLGQGSGPFGRPCTVISQALSVSQNQRLCVYRTRSSMPAVPSCVEPTNQPFARPVFHQSVLDKQVCPCPSSQHSQD